MKNLRVLLIPLLIFGLFSILNAQRQTGSIAGVVTDEEGAPLPGVTITVSGSSLIGTMSYITSESGAFRIPALPPGTYTLVAELPGFQTVRREGIVVSVGMTVRVQIQMKPAKIEEEVTVVGESPVVDVVSSKVDTVIKSDQLRNLPIGRNLYSIIQLAPGVVGYNISGGTVISNQYRIDGVNVNDPCNNLLGTGVDFNIIEEAEVITGGVPAEAGATTGGYVNVVTKSGSNEFSGTVQIYAAPEKTVQILFPDTQLKALGVGKPVSPIYDIDASVTFSGPIKKDKIWFITSFNYLPTKYHSVFKPTVILGKKYDAFDYTARTLRGFLKLTFQLAKNIRSSVMVNYDGWDTDYAEAAWYKPKEATYQFHDKTLTATGLINWIIDQNTYLDVRLGVLNEIFDLPLQSDELSDVPWYEDWYTGYYWGGGGYRFNEYVLRRSIQASVHLTRFQDNFLGGNHEFKAGFEIQTGLDKWNWWKRNPMYWAYWNGNPYVWRGMYGLNEPHPWYGDGYIMFAPCATTKEDSYSQGDTLRIGGYIQDSWTIKNRLTINAGVRFETINGNLPGIEKGRIGNDVAYAIGEYYFVPVYGFNPFGYLKEEPWEDVMRWTTVAPRIGVSYDIFGDGKTSLKLSYAKYSDTLPTMFFQTVHPFRPWFFAFYWWDLNENVQLDPPPVDKYYPIDSPIRMVRDYWEKMIGKDVKAPYANEFTVSLQHELFTNFKVGLTYIFRDKKNIADSCLYDPDSDRYWYHYDLAPDWWVPFETIVPAYGPFPDQKVTVYFVSNNAPAALFYAFQNIPEAMRKYQALEITFEKRMSHGWQLAGSITLSKNYGNYPGSYGASWGWAGACDTPNWFVNRGEDARVPEDRPLLIKLNGSFNLPYGFVASFYYTHFDGAPWGRTITVYPPAGWAAANNVNPWYTWWVYVEKPGTRRNQATDNVDFRLEKRFSLGDKGVLGIFVDVFNLLGNSYVFVEQDPGGTWYPVDANTNVGTYIPSPWYGKATGISGSRIFKFSIRFEF